MKPNNYYEILGLTKESSYEDIKNKYKELAIKYHPDKNNDPEAADKFIKINEAYKTIVDPYSRGRYDTLVEYNLNISPDTQQDYSDIKLNSDIAIKIFNDIFNSGTFYIVDTESYSDSGSSHKKKYDKSKKKPEKPKSDKYTKSIKPVRSEKTYKSNKTDKYKSDKSKTDKYKRR